MTNILKRVLSIRSLSDAASPPELDNEDTLIDSEPESTIVEADIEPIPNFAEKGITDHTEILIELIYGPSISIHVGKEAILYTIPLRLLNYHSNIAARNLSSKADTEHQLFLPNIHPHAFAHIYRWMHQDKIDILAHVALTSSSILTGLQNACTLLCRVFAAAKDLGIHTLQTLAIDELKIVFATARDGGNVTPVLPSLVLEVWEGCAGVEENEDEEEEKEDEEEDLLWQLILNEMCIAFSRKPMPVFAEFDECWKRIDLFRSQVGGAMADRIRGDSAGEVRPTKRVKLEVDDDDDDDLYV